MIDRLVLDAGVALSWIVPDASAEQRAYATAVLKAVEREQPKLVVPYFFSVEVVAVMLRACRLRVISQEAVDRGFSMLESLPIEVHQRSEDLGEFINLGKRYNLQPHDALYVALARDLAIPIAAFDPAIRSSCRNFGVGIYAT